MFTDSQSDKCSYCYSNEESDYASTKAEEVSDQGDRGDYTAEWLNNFGRRGYGYTGNSDGECDTMWTDFNDRRGGRHQYTANNRENRKRKATESQKEEYSESESKFAEEIQNNRGSDITRTGTFGRWDDVNTSTDASFLERGNSPQHCGDLETSSNDSITREEIRREETFIFDVARNSCYIKKPESSKDRIRRMFNQGFRERSPRKRILHDVYGASIDSGTIRLDTRQIHRRFTGTILIITYHRDHWHVVHDCSYSNSSCRCEFANFFKTCGLFGKRYSRRIIPGYDFGTEHWVNLSIYFEKVIFLMLFLPILINFYCRQGDNVVTLSSPGESGYRVVKLDIYDFKKICSLSKDQWWKQAMYRTTFLTTSVADPKEQMVQRLLQQAALDLQKLPNTKKEAKVMKSYNFYRNDQHRQ